ncbi:Uncharacterized protein OS=Sorangium cellulosum (strain So ce56) GN=sce5710 PE=4 SV=1 [Gemmataceae bacterium]|nr:Uncharacterized protein OS=Sorangium cellulosum (strain So ce56) GN=sce5710 PE=4 SV=1 [Gemmataceae bacterium]VTT98782.1 Uncharacterized protein OS=Sorangium cellulosum (strain So ce56) GN=sce5710 PE=4 SV=1 [Gemmataceae bacterium]
MARPTSSPQQHQAGEPATIDRSPGAPLPDRTNGPPPDQRPVVWVRPTSGKQGRFSLRSPTGRSALGIDDYLLDLWLSSEPARVEVLARLELSPRLTRLFAVALCGDVRELLTDDRSRMAVEVAERFADDGATVRELRVARRAASDAYFELGATHGTARSSASVLSCLAANAARHAVDMHVKASTVATDVAALAVDVAALAATGRGEVDPVGERRIRERQGRLLAAIVGPGYELLPEWHTADAVGLASTCYETKDWSIMPVLADALQDAGCENDDVLGHCRGPGPHVRGDWVLDSLLGLK